MPLAATRAVTGFALFAAVSFLAGCAATPKPDENHFAEATHEFKGETRERIVRAAEIVLKQSDPAFKFQYSLSGFTGFRPYVLYAVIAAQTGTEKWELQTEQNSNSVRASIGISETRRAFAAGAPPSQGEGAMGSVPLYRLFWARAEYVLERRPDWITCDEALGDLEKQGINGIEALSGICGLTSMGRNAPPPERLPAALLASQPKTKR
jgi:hypothetical protein